MSLRFGGAYRVEGPPPTNRMECARGVGGGSVGHLKTFKRR